MAVRDTDYSDAEGISPFHYHSNCQREHNFMFKHGFAIGMMFMAFNANAVSFDCNKASTPIEKAICSDPLLGKLDDALTQNYKRMLAANIGDGAKSDLRATQKAWMAARNKCTNNSCIAEAYRQRVDLRLPRHIWCSPRMHQFRRGCRRGKSTRTSSATFANDPNRNGSRQNI